MSLTAEQLEVKQSHIGGSDMAALLGLSPYEQPLDVFNRIVHGIDQGVNPDSEPVYWGNALEDAIAARYERDTGEKLRNMPGKQHPDFAFFHGHLDRKIEGKKRGVEIKNVGWRVAHHWGEPGTDQVAEYYLPQVHFYNFLYDYESFDVAAVVGGNDFQMWTVDRDYSWDDLIIAAGTKFWQEHVETETPPDVDFAHGRIADLMKRTYPTVDASNTVDLHDDGVMWHNVLADAQQRAKEYKGVIDGAKAHLQHLMGDAAVAYLPDGTGYTRKEVSRKGYEVDPTSYVDFRHTKKPPKRQEAQDNE